MTAAAVFALLVSLAALAVAGMAARAAGTSAVRAHRWALLASDDLARINQRAAQLDSRHCPPTACRDGGAK